MSDKATERPKKRAWARAKMIRIPPRSQPSPQEAGLRQKNLRVLAVLPNRAKRDITVVDTNPFAKEFLDFISAPEVNCDFLASCDRDFDDTGMEAAVPRIFEMQGTDPRCCELTSAAAVWVWLLCRRMNASLEVDRNQDPSERGQDVLSTEPVVNNLKFTFASTFVEWTKDPESLGRLDLMINRLDVVVLPDLDAFAEIDPLTVGECSYADHVLQYCSYDLTIYQVKVFPPQSVVGFLMQRGDIRDKSMETLRIPQVRRIVLGDDWNSTMPTVLNNFRTKYPGWESNSLAQANRYVVKHRFGTQPKRVAFVHQVERDGSREWVGTRPDGTVLTVAGLVGAWAPYSPTEGVSFEPYVHNCRNQEIRVFTSVTANWRSAVDLYAVTSRLSEDGQHEITQRNHPVETCFGPQALYHRFIARRTDFLRMLTQMVFHPLVGHVFRFDCFVHENDVFINDVHVMGVADTYSNDPAGVDATNMMAMAEATHRFVLYALEHGWPV